MRILAAIVTCLVCNAACFIFLYFGRYLSPAGEERKSGSTEKEQKAIDGNFLRFSDDKTINILVWAGGLFVQTAVVYKAAAGITDALTGIVFIALAVWLFYIAMIDARVRLIPNRMLLGMLTVRVVLWVFKWARDGLPEKGVVLYQIIYPVVILIFLLFIVVVSKGGFGYGDVKLLTVLSLFLDYGFLLSTLLTALLGALAASAYLLMVKKRDRKATIPFGPFFYFGYIINALIML